MAGIGQGAAEGGMGYLAAQEEAEARRGEEERARKEREALLAGNVAAPYNIQPAKFSFAENTTRTQGLDWWKKHLGVTPQGEAANA
jgi:hypothetical protein